MQIRGRSLSATLYRQRRRQASKFLQQAFDRNVPILLIGVPESDLSTQVQTQVGRRRQDPWFDWFCGCHEPDAALLIDPTTASQTDTLFLDPGDPARVVWDGPRLQPGAGAKRSFGVHACKRIDDLLPAVQEAAERAGGRVAMFWRKVEPGFQSDASSRWRRRLRGIQVLNAEPLLVHMRMVKHAEEIAWHRKAVKATALGLKRLYAALPAMKNEAQAAALLADAYLQEAYECPAFAPIVGGGVNAATLHYPHNDQPLSGNPCVLIDSGARSGGYCADVTRTVPKRGRYGHGRFREIYELVLKSQKLGIAHARPGITLKEWNDIAWQPILDAGFQRHHGLGHHLGLDVHDPADRELALQPGMLITCEPGIYLPDEAIGVRIEDNLLITAKGCENTTRAIPTSVAAIEKLFG